MARGSTEHLCVTRGLCADLEELEVSRKVPGMFQSTSLKTTITLFPRAVSKHGAFSKRASALPHNLSLRFESKQEREGSVQRSPRTFESLPHHFWVSAECTQNEA